jgi:hypothetical protein
MHARLLMKILVVGLKVGEIILRVAGSATAFSRITTSKLNF